MSNDAKHSPLPFRWATDLLGGVLEPRALVDRNEKDVLTFCPVTNKEGRPLVILRVSHEDADFIIQATSSHDELVGACEQAKTVLRAYVDHEPVEMCAMAEAFEELRAVLLATAGEEA